MLIVILQGMTLIGVDALADSSRPNQCAEHQQSMDDCPCCPDGIASSGSCDDFCSPIAALSGAPASVFASASALDIRALEAGRFGPTYVPAHPPPI
jgi:hypothetical protein